MEPIHVQLLMEGCIELPLVIFSIVTLVCIIRKFRDGALGFTTDFFLFYIAQSFVDLGDYFVYLIYNRLTRDGLLPFLTGFPWVNIFHCTHVYLAYVQRTMHAMIAYNRFTALSNTSHLAHALLNKYRKTRRILLITFLLPIVTITPGLLSRLEFGPSTTPPQLRMTISNTWAGMAFSTSGMLITTLTTSTCVFFDIRAYMAYRTLSSYRRNALQHEIYLFGFALLHTAVQLLISAITVLLVIGSYTKNAPLTAAVQNYYTAINDVYTFSSPIFLFITSTHVRRALLPRCRITISTAPEVSVNRITVMPSRFTM